MQKYTSNIWKPGRDSSSLRVRTCLCTHHNTSTKRFDVCNLTPRTSCLFIVHEGLSIVNIVTLQSYEDSLLIMRDKIQIDP